jgi:hypothetical protein
MEMNVPESEQQLNRVRSSGLRAHHKVHVVQKRFICGWLRLSVLKLGDATDAAVSRVIGNKYRAE